VENSNPSLLERRLKLLDELMEIAGRIDPSRVWRIIDRINKVTGIASSLYTNTYLYLSGEIRNEMPIVSGRSVYYAWLGVTSLWYLSRQGFGDILAYLPKADQYGMASALSSLVHEEEKCLSEVFGEIIAGTDAEGYPHLFGIDLTPIPPECGKLKSIELLLAWLGSIIHEMLLNLKVPHTIEYPIVPLSTEIATNIINWGSGASSLSYYTVEANIGMGKTTFVYKSIMGAIRLLTGQPPEAYKLRVWDLFITEADELNDVLSQYRGMPENYFIPILVIEDATHVFPKDWIWRGKQFIQLMNRVHEGLIHMRGRMANLIMNANSVSNLASFARNLAHKRLLGTEANIGSAKHTIFFSPVKKYVSTRRGREKNRFLGAVAYPLTKLPDEIYKLDLEHKNKILARDFSNSPEEAEAQQ